MSGKGSRITSAIEKGEKIRKESTLRDIIISDKKKVAESLGDLHEDITSIIEDLNEFNTTPSYKEKNTQAELIVAKLTHIHESLNKKYASNSGITKEHLINEQKYKKLKEYVESNNYSSTKNIPEELEIMHQQYRNEMKQIQQADNIVWGFIRKLTNSYTSKRSYAVSTKHKDISDLIEALQTYDQLT